MLPINRRVLAGRGLPEAEARRLLARWATQHWIRIGRGLAGLVVLILATLLR